MNQLYDILEILMVSANMRFDDFWPWGEVLRYRILGAIQPWFSLTDFELLPGLVFGDTDLLTTSTKQHLKTLGILHALSASGTNVGIVAHFATKLTQFGGRTAKMTCTMGLLLVYLCLVGKSAPIIRAVLSRLYMYVGWYGHRQISPLLAWFFSASTMIAIRPAFLTEASYQLSVLASLGIALLLPRLSMDNLHQPGRLADMFREAFWQTAAAQLFVLPLTTVLFGESPTSSLLTNTILAPFLTLLTLAAFFLAGFGAFYSLFSAYDLWWFAIPFQTLQMGSILIYRLINQSFLAAISLIHYQAAVINQLISVWWVIVVMLLLFAFHFGQNYRRVHHSLKLVQRF